MNPLTEIRYEKDGSIEILDEWKKYIQKFSEINSSKVGRRKGRAKYYSEPEFVFSDLPPWARELIFIFFIGIIFWVIIVQPILEWLFRNILLIIIILVPLIFLYSKRKEEKEAEKKAFEKEQKLKGLIKFIDRFGNERWGKPAEVEKWKKENAEAKEKEKIINRVVEEIEKFKPFRKYKEEFPYQLDLARHLKSNFPDVDIEEQKGSSRPDIVVEDVAIEVKGPTRNKDLRTIADKCMRYYQHYGKIVIVLFDVNVYDRYYDEWKHGVKKYFPNVKIIRKD